VNAAVTAIVLAAGAGTRMRSSTAKVLHEIGGRSLLGHALAAARAAQPDDVVVVVGHQREEVSEHAQACDPGVRTAIQAEQKGTGHAVQIALQALDASEGTVLVTSGDVPLLGADTLRALVADQVSGGHAVSLLTAELPDPSGYGRILRDDSGAVRAIREHRDAAPDELAVQEVNAGTYAFDADFLAAALKQVGTANAQGEVYLTDVVELAVAQGHTASAVVCADVWQTEGVNDRVQLARLGTELNRRTLERWMRAGVTVVDPTSTFVDVSVELAADVTLLPGTQLHGATSVQVGASIGPDTT
jgi:bifunctional UDP-N-acetylglucosamine pyrophosphorylase/glucosamine-1-phosphate N-acetyltransferase